MPKMSSFHSVSVSPPSRKTSAAQNSFKGFCREGVAFDRLAMCRISCGAGRGGGTLDRLQVSVSSWSWRVARSSRVWGHQPALLLTRSCVFSWFSFSLFPHSSFFCCSLSCQHCCALTVWRVSAKLPKREAITWMPKLYILAANPCNSQPIWKQLNFSVDL